MLQAIVTKYLGPTNHRPARIVASCQAGRVTINYMDGLNLDQNHEAAMLALRVKMGWADDYGRSWGGWLPSGDGVWVMSGRAERSQTV